MLPSSSTTRTFFAIVQISFAAAQGRICLKLYYYILFLPPGEHLIRRKM